MVDKVWYSRRTAAMSARFVLLGCLRDERSKAPSHAYRCGDCAVAALPMKPGE
jgi:hypothetical protein